MRRRAGKTKKPVEATPEGGNRGRRGGVKRFIAGCLLLLAGCWAGWIWLISPPRRAHIPVRLTVPRNSGLLDIGDLLQRSGIVRSGWAFALYAATHRGHHALRAGRHTLAGDMTQAQVLAALQQEEPGVEGIRITVPEGFTLEQIADRLDTEGLVTKEEFLAAAHNHALLADLSADFSLPSDTPEGYLYPDAYEFPPHTTAAQVLQEMLLNFGRRFARPYQRELATAPHTLHEIVTIASLIEREARVPGDRPRIAGVIENRLRRHMRLEIDATVLYALGHHKSRVTFKDLEVRSPYNTYRHKGLPPGPIANPGLASLLAALHPEANDYIFYVARPNGAHLFTRTPAEHEAAKREVRRERQGIGADTEADSGG